MADNVIRRDTIELEFQANRNGLDDVVNGVRGLQRNVEGTTRSVDGFDRALGAIKNVAKIAAVATAFIGIGRAIKSAVSSASEFQDAMAKVNTIADTNSVSLDDLSKQVMDLSNKSGISATEIADATYNAISAGQQTADAVNFVENATSLARAGFTDTGASIDILTTIMNAYGMEADRVGSVSDMLIQTQNKGKTTVAELAAAMGKVIPTANSMNVGLEQLTAGYAIMTANGIATAETTTYMNSMLNELGKSSTNAGKMLKKSTGKSFQELIASGNSVGDVLQILKDEAAKTGTAFNEIWGSAEAGKAGLVLLSNGAAGYNDMVKQMLESTGATQEALKKLETPSQKAKVAMNQLKNAGIELGTGLLAMAAPLIDKVTSGLGQITGALNDFFKTGDILAFKKAFGSGLTGIADILNDVVKQITDTLANSGAWLVRIVVEVAGKLLSGITGVLPNLINAGMEMISALVAGVGAAAPEIIAALVTAVSDSVNVILEDLPGFIEAGMVLIDGLVKGIIQSLPIIVGTVPTIITALITALNVSIQLIADYGGDIIQALIGGIISVLPDIAQAAPLLVSTLVEGITQSLSLIISCTIELVNALIVGINDNRGLLVDGAVQLIVGLTIAIVENAPLIISGAVELIGALTTGLISMVPNILVFVGVLFTSLWDGIVNQDWQSISDSIWDGVFKGSENMVEKIKTSLANIGEAIIGVGSTDSFDGVFGWIDEIIDNVKNSLAEAWTMFTNELIDISAWIDANVIQPIVTYCTELSDKTVQIFNDIVEAVKNAWKSISEWVDANVIQPIVEFWIALQDKTVQIFNNIVESIKSIFGVVLNWIDTNMIQPIVMLFENLFFFIIGLGAVIYEGLCEALAPVVDWISANIIQPIIDYFVSGWNNTVTTVTAVIAIIQELWNRFTDWVNISIIQPVIQSFQEAWNSVEVGVDNTVGKVQLSWSAFVEWIGGIVQSIVQFFADCWNFVTTTVTTAIAIIQGLWNSFTIWVSTGIVQPIIQFFTDLWIQIVQTATNIYNSIVSAWCSLANWVNTTIIQPIISFFTDLWNKITQIAENIYNAIVNAWKILAGWVLNNVINPIKNYFTDLWNNITSGIESAKSTIVSAFETAYNSVTSVWEGITGFFQGIWDKVSGIAKDIIDKGKKVMGVSSDATAHADGGLVTTPHLGLVGEAGPEMIIPLSAGKRNRGLDLLNQTANIMGVSDVEQAVSGSVAYTPDNEPYYTTSKKTVNEYNNYSPVFNLTINGAEDTRSIERKVKQWVKESMSDMFDGMARKNPRLREV